jgi:hypothetical protein
LVETAMYVADPTRLISSTSNLLNGCWLTSSYRIDARA